MATKLYARPEYLIVESEEKEKTDSGFYLANEAKDVPVISKVVQSGPETEDIKAGYRVVHFKYAGLEWEVEDRRKVKAIHIDDVVAVYEES